MLIETLSTFPHMYDSVMGESMMKRAQSKGLLDFRAHDLRDWTHDRHRTTDDDPYGGGSGLVMKCEPIFEAAEDLLGAEEVSRRISSGEGSDESPTVIFLAPQGKRFDDALASNLATRDHLLFICGHYEGIDERAYALADDTISLGDYVLTSGELASMVVIDAVVRKIPGVLGAEDGAELESFADGLLEHPQYTRPPEFRGMEVPGVLLSGDHGKVRAWRRERSLARTAAFRPDLIDTAISAGSLSSADLEFLQTLDDSYLKA